jgi:hypothetical protein
MIRIFDEFAIKFKVRIKTGNTNIWRWTMTSSKEYDQNNKAEQQ